MSSDNLSNGPDRATDYEPRYVNIKDVPIGNFKSEQDFSEKRKRLALKEAEGLFETGVNDGDPIDADSVANSHWAAVRNLVSFVLYHPALDPRGGISLGQVEEYGEEQSDYVDKYYSRYRDAVESINEASGGGDDSVEDTDGSDVRSSLI